MPSMRLTGMLTAAVVVGGCVTQVTFTKNLRDRYHLQADEIRQIQFFISDAVSLDRNSTSGTQRNVTEKHALEVQHTTKEERLSIAKGTPGIVVGVAGDDLEVDFGGGLLCTFSPVVFGPNDVPYLLARINGQPVKRTGSTWVQISGVWYLYSSEAPYGPYLQAEISETSIADRRATSVEGRKL